MNQSNFCFSKPEEVDEQLTREQQSIHFDIKEFTIEFLVQKYTKNDFKIPDYQREFTWKEPKQSKFIESLLLGLPVPFLFGVLDQRQEGAISIIDGRQRLETLRRYVSNELQLEELERLDRLEGSTYSQLSSLQRRKFDNRSIRLILLDSADSSTQFDMFERINTTPEKPERAEIRRGSFPGLFTDLMIEYAKDQRFIDLTPMNDSLVDKREREELVIRFFCYRERYQKFKHAVGSFLDEYLIEKNEELKNSPGLIRNYKSAFDEMCSFAQKHFSSGFASPGRRQTPRVRFEALAVGSSLALQAEPTLMDQELDVSWMDQPKGAFSALVKTDASNSKTKLSARIEFAMNSLLDNPNVSS